jgi:NADP-dependent 3-hydroxy acid dehydrogenase YdfG
MISPWWLNTSSNIWPEGRETKIAELYGKEIGTMLDTGKVAKFVYSLIKLPKNMEVSEVIINRN